MYDGYLTKKIIEASLLMEGVSLESIRAMTDREVMEYFWVIGEIKKKRMED